MQAAFDKAKAAAMAQPTRGRAHQHQHQHQQEIAEESGGSGKGDTAAAAASSTAQQTLHSVSQKLQKAVEEGIGSIQTMISEQQQTWAGRTSPTRRYPSISIIG